MADQHVWSYRMPLQLHEKVSEWQDGRGLTTFTDAVTQLLWQGLEAEKLRRKLDKIMAADDETDED